MISFPGSAGGVSALFLLNFLLTIVDASLGWRTLPPLLRRTAPPGSSPRVDLILALSVTFYMFLNALGYRRESPRFLLVVTLLLLLDLAGQLYLLFRNRGR